jgi:DNA-binding MarR family transcriptional regulator
VATNVATGELAELASQLQVAVGRIVRRLRQGQEPGDTTPSELSVLSRVERCGGLTAGAIAEQERVSPQAMSVIISTLEQRGLIARVADEDDGRRTTITATSTGEQLLAGRRSRTAHRITQALEQTLPPGELSQLAATVALLERLADQL